MVRTAPTSTPTVTLRAAAVSAIPICRGNAPPSWPMMITVPRPLWHTGTVPGCRDAPTHPVHRDGTTGAAASVGRVRASRRSPVGRVRDGNVPSRPRTATSWSARCPVRWPARPIDVRVASSSSTPVTLTWWSGRNGYPSTRVGWPIGGTGTPLAGNGAHPVADPADWPEGRPSAPVSDTCGRVCTRTDHGEAESCQERTRTGSR